MWPHIIRSSTRSCPSCGQRWRDLAPNDPGHPDHHHRRRCRWHTDIRCRPLGGQPAPPGAVQPTPSPPPAPRHGTFVEISPHPLLTHAITDTLDTAVVTSAMNRDQDQTLFFHAQLAAVGAAPSGTTAGRLAEIPHAPVAPFDASGSRTDRRSAELSSTHPLLGAHMELPSGRDHVWQADVGTDVCPWLADHKVGGQPILPAAAFAEIALGGRQRSARPARPRRVGDAARSRADAAARRPYPDNDSTQSGRGRCGPRRNPFAFGQRQLVPARRRQSRAAARGQLARPARRAPSSPSGTEVSPADFYATLRQTGQHHGPAFAALTRIVRQPDGSSETEITVPEEASRHPGFRVHPVMLDAALQSMAAAMPDRTVAEAAEVSYLPVSFEKIRVFREVGRHARCHAEVVDLDEAGAGKLGTVILTDDAGNPTAEITGIYVRRVERRALPLPLEQKIFDTAWVPSPAADRARGTVARQLARAGRRDGRQGDGGGVRGTMALAGAAGGHRQPRRRVRGAGRLRRNRRGRRASTRRRGPLRRSGSTDLGEAVTRARDSIWSIASTVRAVVGGWHGRSPRLWLVTRQGLVVHGDEPGDPATGALKGLIRVLAYEHPDLRATLVDLDRGEDVLAALTAELGCSDSDDVIAWRSGHRYVERLSPGESGCVRTPPGGPRRCRVHRHRRSRRTRSGGRPMARRQRCGPRRAQRSQRTVRRAAQSPRRTGGRGRNRRRHRRCRRTGGGRATGGRGRGDRHSNCAASCTGRR